MSNNYLIKLIVVGDSGVGKSCLLLRFVDNRFRPDHDLTIGAEFGSRVIEVAGESVHMQIWDTAGQERYKSFTKAYFKDCKGILMVYDITSRKSFDNLENWFRLSEEQSKVDNLPIVLVGNKTDLDERRLVPTLEGEDMADQKGTGFIETSAYSNRGDCVGKAFYLLLKRIMSHPDLFKEEEHTPKPVRKRPSDAIQLPIGLKPNYSLDQDSPEPEKKKKGCC